MASRASSTATALDAALRAIPALPPRLLYRFVARAIERLDELGGDPELEDATCAEDEGITWVAANYSSGDYPGCPVGDPGGGNVDDRGGEQERCIPEYGIDQSLGSLSLWGTATGPIHSKR